MDGNVCMTRMSAGSIVGAMDGSSRVLSGASA